MAKINVHAGDWAKGSGNYMLGSFVLPKKTGWGGSEAIHSTDIVELELASEESVKRLGGTIGWGAIGGLALGPVGLLAGLIAGGRGTEVTFVAKFKDGRRLLASTDSKTFNSIRAAKF